MTDVAEFARLFARAIVNGNPESAHEKLSHAYQQVTTAADLSEPFDVLAEEMGGVSGIGAPTVILEEWPNMAPTDRAMVYVPLEGDVVSEAVTGTICAIGDGLRISKIARASKLEN